jgi:hypothetical protein
MKSLFALFLASATTLGAADQPVFSGPQPGESTSAFRAVDIIGPGAGQERDPITSNAGAPTALVFVHGLERSMLPLMRAVDQYGVRHAEQLRTEFVFLAEDRVDGMERFGRALRSIQLKGRSTLSVDGIEGPGNYGLNRQCLLTILAAKDNRVHANFALVQPGIADGGRVLAALGKLINDPNPPTTEQLKAEFEKGYRMNRGRNAPKEKDGRMTEAKKDPFPGAVPTDETLVGLLRRFIRKTNDDQQVDAVLAEVRAHIAGRDDLRRQAQDGWIRILHFGDRYGTDYARNRGQAFLNELQESK